jgi:N-hydroxyarylamine O-acetyltransferase
VNDSWVDAYLARIGAERPARPDIGSLRDLHLRHLRTVPFENLGIHLGEDIVLESGALVAKIVDRRRGGFCYELNGAFGALLSALGFEVDLLAARVFAGDGLGVPYDHLALRVGPWLADFRGSACGPRFRGSTGEAHAGSAPGPTNRIWPGLTA